MKSEMEKRKPFPDNLAMCITENYLFFYILRDENDPTTLIEST